MPLVFHWAKAPQSWDRSITNSTHRLSRCALSGPRHGGQTSLVEPVRGIGALRRRGAAGAGATAARRHTAGGSSTRTGLTPAATSGSPLRALGLGARLQSQRWWRQHAGGSVIAGKKLVDRLSTKAEVQGGKSVTSSAEPPPTSWPLGWSTPSQEPSRR